MDEILICYRVIKNGHLYFVMAPDDEAGPLVLERTHAMNLPEGTDIGSVWMYKDGKPILVGDIHSA